jgi:hypothetical protein
MVDLLKGLVQVKDPLTLFAFVLLVLLAAFRTKGVPQLFLKLLFKLLSPLSSEQISLLLKRFMRYGFTAFVLVCGIAAAGQVLAFVERSRPYSVEDVRKQLERDGTTASQKQAAVDAYSKGLSSLDKGEFDLAIQSLRESLDAVPTLAAQYTLALAYQQDKDKNNAAKFAGEALATAKSQGDPGAVVRAEQLVKSTVGAAPPPVPPGTNPAGGSKPSIFGPKSPFPAGGRSSDEATPVSPGGYVWKDHLDSRIFRYYKISLKAGQTLSIDFKTPDTVAASGYWSSGGASIYDGNGDLKASDYILNSRSELKSIRWTSPTSGWIYLSVGNSAGAGWPNDPDIVYVIWVQ